MPKEIVALDIDDVVVKHVEGFIAWSNLMLGTSLTTADYSEVWHELWGVSLDECEERKKQFFQDEVIAGFETIEGAREGIIALSSVRSVVAVTARREGLQRITEQTLEALAPGGVDRVICATFFRNGEKITRTKSDICKDIGATALVDDQFKHCIAAANIGIHAFLFGNYDWQKIPMKLPSNVSRVENWEEFLSHFEIST